MYVTRLSTRDAREYLTTVRYTFQNNREIYAEFLKVMKDFKVNRIDRNAVRSKVKILFKGHQELITGLDKFLSKCSKKPVESDQTGGPVTYGEAIDFVNKVKARFQDDDRPYKCFLAILKMYRENIISPSEVYHEVFCVLFRNQHDLRVEFVQFLPHLL